MAKAKPAKASKGGGKKLPPWLKGDGVEAGGELGPMMPPMMPKGKGKARAGKGKAAPKAKK